MGGGGREGEREGRIKCLSFIYFYLFIDDLKSAVDAIFAPVDFPQSLDAIALQNMIASPPIPIFSLQPDLSPFTSNTSPIFSRKLLNFLESSLSMNLPGIFLLDPLHLSHLLSLPPSPSPSHLFPSAFSCILIFLYSPLFLLLPILIYFYI